MRDRPRGRNRGAESDSGSDGEMSVTAKNGRFLRSWCRFGVGLTGWSSPASPLLQNCLGILEAPPGFEPGMEVLQTSALPLGDGAVRREPLLTER